MGTDSRDTVLLIPDKLLMEQKLDMTMFSITLYNLENNDNHDGIRVLIQMKRKFLSEIMTTYFPSFLLLAITFATTFFKPFFFEAALSVNLTTMLVMTTIFISKMEGLPPTSAVKMIDYWLVICQMVPFSEVVLLTVMEYNREDKKKTKKKTKKKGKTTKKKGEKTKKVVLQKREYKRTEEKDKITQSRFVEVGPLNEKEIEIEEMEKRRWHQDLNLTRLIPSLKTLGEI